MKNPCKLAFSLARSNIFSDLRKEWMRYWQLMPLLWPLVCYNTIVITSLLSNRRPSQFRVCDSLPLISPVLVPTQWQQQGVHHVEIDHSNQCHPRKPFGSAAAAQQKAWAVLRLVCDISSFKWELGVESICYRRLIFHWWPGSKTEGKDGMMTWHCKAHGRSFLKASLNRKRPQPIGEKKRGKFVVRRRTKRCNRGLDATQTAAWQLVDSVNL